MARKITSLAITAMIVVAYTSMLVTPADAASQATATSVALNGTVADCSRADLNIGVAAGTVDREMGRATNKYGLELSQFDNPSTLSGTTGIVPYGIPIDGEQLDGTIIGSYAALGTSPPQTATTAEWFVLYECDTDGANTVLYTCFGDYGTCPQTAAQGLDLLLSVSVSNATPAPGETLTVTATGCLPEASAVAAVSLLRDGIQIAGSSSFITPNADGSFTTQLTVPTSLPGGTALVLRTVCGDGDVAFASFDIALTVAGGAPPTTSEPEPGSTTAPERASTQPRFTG